MSTDNDDYRPIYIQHVERKTLLSKICDEVITKFHYLHKMPDARTSYEIYAIYLNGMVGEAGWLVFGRPQCTFYRGWFGSVEDVQTGVCECTRWQVLNLARVWIHPKLQTGGEFCEEGRVPGFRDRKGEWRSTVASVAIKAAMEVVRVDYLVRRPPVFLDEPYELRWLLSYCDTKVHKGTIYQASGFEAFAINDDLTQTWRIPLRPLNWVEDLKIGHAAERDPRGIKMRAERSQMRLEV